MFQQISKKLFKKSDPVLLLRFTTDELREFIDSSAEIQCVNFLLSNSFTHTNQNQNVKLIN